MSALETEVPVHKVAKTLFHLDVNTKASQTGAMHAGCTVLVAQFLMEAYICVCPTHFKDRFYGHYKEHARYFRELAKTMEEKSELSCKDYTDLKAKLVLEKRKEEECIQRVEHREGNVLSALHRCNFDSDPNVSK